MTTTSPPIPTTLPNLKGKSDTIRDLMLRNRAQFEMALPRLMSVDRLIRTAMTSFHATPALLDCTPRSLLGAVIQCAQLGLEPGVLGQAYLVPFHSGRTNTTEVQFIVGYKGLLTLARRTGEISTIQAHVVHAKDRFTYSFGLAPTLEHRPTDEPDPGPARHVYAVARLKDGGIQCEVMTWSEVERHRDRYSRAARSGPWVTHPEEMALKTCLRRLVKLLPVSVEAQRAVLLDEAAEAQLPQHLGDLIALPDDGRDDESAVAPAASARLDALTATLGTDPRHEAVPESPAAEPSAPASAEPALTERALLLARIAECRQRLDDGTVDGTVVQILRRHELEVEDLGGTDLAVLQAVLAELLALVAERSSSGGKAASARGGARR